MSGLKRFANDCICLYIQVAYVIIIIFDTQFLMIAVVFKI